MLKSSTYGWLVLSFSTTHWFNLAVSVGAGWGRSGGFWGKRKFTSIYPSVILPLHNGSPQILPTTTVLFGADQQLPHHFQSCLCSWLPFFQCLYTGHVYMPRTCPFTFLISWLWKSWELLGVRGCEKMFYLHASLWSVAYQGGLGSKCPWAPGGGGEQTCPLLPLVAPHLLPLRSRGHPPPPLLQKVFWEPRKPHVVFLTLRGQKRSLPGLSQKPELTIFGFQKAAWGPGRLCMGSLALKVPPGSGSQCEGDPFRWGWHPCRSTPQAPTPPQEYYCLRYAPFKLCYAPFKPL